MFHKIINISSAFAIIFFFGIQCYAPQDMFGQLRSVTGELCVNMQQDRFEQGAVRSDERVLLQQYFLNAGGYVVDPRLLEFDVRTSFTDYSSRFSIGSSDRSMHRRDWGYYDLNMVLFPNNGFRLSARAKNDRVESEVRSPLSGWNGINKPGTLYLTGHELEVSIPGNTIYPRITASVQRETQQGQLMAYAVDQVVQGYELKLGNANSSGALYEFSYDGYDVEDRVRAQLVRTHQFRLHGETRLYPMLQISANTYYAIHNDARSTSIHLLADDLRSNAVQHRVSITHQVTSYVRANLMRFTTDHLSYRSVLRAGESLMLNLGGDVRIGRQDTPDQHAAGGEGRVQAEGLYEPRIGGARLHFSAATDAGWERLPGGTEGMVHASRFAVGLLANLFGSSTLSVRDDCHLQRQLMVGESWGNVVRAEAILNVSYAVRLVSRYQRSDLVQVSRTELPSMRHQSWENEFSWNIGGKTSLLGNFTRRVSSMWYEDVSTRYMAGISQSELLPRLSLSMSIDFTHSSYALQDITHLEGELRYRLYALTFIARYVRDIIGSYDRNRFQFEVRRPLDFRFQ